MTPIAEAASLEVGFWIDLATLIVESVIVILLYRTVKDCSEIAKQGRIEAKQRFRPWVGPPSGIEFVQQKDGKE